MNVPRAARTLDHRVSRRGLLALGLAGSAALATAACSTAPAPQPQSKPAASPGAQPGTAPAAATAASKPAAQPARLAESVVVGRQVSPRSVDPHMSTSLSYYLEPNPIYDRLITFDVKGEKIVPQVAASWTQVGPTTVELKLRDDVKFSNGDPVTAEVIKANVDRALDRERAKDQAIIQQVLTTIAGAEAVNSTTLRVTTKATDPHVLNRLTNLFIGNPKQFNSPDINLLPIGSGPLKVTEFKERDHISYEASATSWRANENVIKTAKVQGIPEMAALIAALQSGDIDVAHDIDGDRANDLKAEYHVIDQPNGATSVMTMFPTKPELRDKRVRQAINYAVNKDQILKSVNGGWGEIAQGQLVDATIEGFDASLKPYPYDPEQARRLLREANVQRLEVVLETASTIQEEAVAISGFLNEIGITAKIVVLEPVVFIQHLLQKTDADIFHWQTNFWQSRIWHDAYRHLARNNDQPHFQNAEFKRLYDQSLVELDREKRLGMIKQAAALVREEAPLLFLQILRNPNALTKKIDAASFIPTYDRSIQFWKIKKQA